MYKIMAVHGQFYDLCFGATLSWYLGLPLTHVNVVTSVQQAHVHHALSGHAISFLPGVLQCKLGVIEDTPTVWGDFMTVTEGPLLLPHKKILMMRTLLGEAIHMVGIECQSLGQWLVFDPLTDSVPGVICQGDLAQVVDSLTQKHHVLPSDCYYQWLGYLPREVTSR